MSDDSDDSGRPQLLEVRGPGATWGDAAAILDRLTRWVLQAPGDLRTHSEECQRWHSTCLARSLRRAFGLDGGHGGLGPAVAWRVRARISDDAWTPWVYFAAEDDLGAWAERHVGQGRTVAVEPLWAGSVGPAS